MIQSGIERGVTEGYEKLDVLLTDETASGTAA